MALVVSSIESVRESATATNMNPYRRSGELRVLLTKDVENVGRAGDVKEVADGYGRNYLLRRKLAVAAGKGAEAEARRLQDAASKRETKDRNEAQGGGYHRTTSTRRCRSSDRSFSTRFRSPRSFSSCIPRTSTGRTTARSTGPRWTFSRRASPSTTSLWRRSCRRWVCSTASAGALSSRRCRARCRPRRTSSTTAGSSRRRRTSGG